MFMIYSDFTNFVRFNPALNYALKKEEESMDPHFSYFPFLPFLPSGRLSVWVSWELGL
jgi:hypothetical protein